METTGKAAQEGHLAAGAGPRPRQRALLAVAGVADAAAAVVAAGQQLAAGLAAAEVAHGARHHGRLGAAGAGALRSQPAGRAGPCKISQIQSWTISLYRYEMVVVTSLVEAAPGIPHSHAS